LGHDNIEGLIYLVSFRSGTGDVLYEIRLERSSKRSETCDEQGERIGSFRRILAWYRGKTVPNDIISAYRELSDIREDEALVGRDLKLSEKSWALVWAWWNASADGEEEDGWSTSTEEFLSGTKAGDSD
jgi:hypothetical protein